MGIDSEIHNEFGSKSISGPPQVVHNVMMTIFDLGLRDGGIELILGALVRSSRIDAKLRSGFGQKVICNHRICTINLWDVGKNKSMAGSDIYYINDAGYRIVFVRR